MVSLLPEPRSLLPVVQRLITSIGVIQRWITDRQQQQQQHHGELQLVWYHFFLSSASLETPLLCPIFSVAMIDAIDMDCKMWKIASPTRKCSLPDWPHFGRGPIRCYSKPSSIRQSVHPVCHFSAVFVAQSRPAKFFYLIWSNPLLLTSFNRACMCACVMHLFMQPISLLRSNQADLVLNKPTETHPEPQTTVHISSRARRFSGTRWCFWVDFFPNGVYSLTRTGEC